MSSIASEKNHYTSAFQVLSLYAIIFFLNPIIVIPFLNRQHSAAVINSPWWVWAADPRLDCERPKSTPPHVEPDSE